MNKQYCKFVSTEGIICKSPYHSRMYHKPKTPIKRTVIKLNPLKMLHATRSQIYNSKTGEPVLPKKPRKKRTDRTKAKPNKTLLKKKLEKLVKDYVKKRDDFTCQRCGLVVDGSNCHASHVIPVSRSGYLQFDPLNMKVLCHFDHLHWWHKHPVEAGKWFTDTFPERWEYLNNLHIQRLKPMTTDELQEKIDYYRGLLK